MSVTCVTIEGENVIVPAAEFDRLVAAEHRCARLEQVASQAREVVGWDWEDAGIDDDVRDEIDLLRKTLRDV